MSNPQWSKLTLTRRSHLTHSHTLLLRRRCRRRRRWRTSPCRGPCRTCSPTPRTQETSSCSNTGAAPSPSSPLDTSRGSGPPAPHRRHPRRLITLILPLPRATLDQFLRLPLQRSVRRSIWIIAWEGGNCMHEIECSRRRGRIYGWLLRWCFIAIFNPLNMSKMEVIDYLFVN